MEQLKIEDSKNERDFSCAFTGHRELFQDFSKTKLKKEIEKLIEKGVLLFYVGMARGFDLVAAEEVIKLKKKYPIQIIACIPYYGQEKNYSEADKKRYCKILKNCDGQVLTTESYYKGCELVRNKYMADNADYLIAYLKKDTGGTAYTVKYFKKKKGENIIFL